MIRKMAAVLRQWREASTLILVTPRRTEAEGVKPTFVSSNPRGSGQEVLLLKRSAKSKFMPNLYVFPGGVADNADFSPEWLQVFGLLGADSKQNLFDFVQRGGQGAPMFSRLRDQVFSHIPSEIAFRICAIRETFEESGVLLTKKIEKNDSFSPRLWDGPSFGSFCEDDSVIEEWRKKVDSDPVQFLRMCQQLRMVPDVWSLYEWSNWITPRESSRRFDTAFFLCCVDSKPYVCEDKGETVHSQWGSPEDILQQFEEGQVRMAPPQLYEIERLLNFQSTRSVLDFSWKRSQHRIERWLPVSVTTADARASVYPGDSLFPGDVDCEATPEDITYSQTLAELSATHPHANRTEISGDAPPPYKTHSNIVHSGGHVAPINIDKYFKNSDNITPKL